MTINIKKFLIVAFASVYIFTNSGCSKSKQEDWNTIKMEESQKFIRIAECIRHSESKEEASGCYDGKDLSRDCLPFEPWLLCKKFKANTYEDLANCISSSNSEQEALNNCYSR